MAKIPDYPVLTAPNDNDKLVIEDSVSSSTKHITRANFLKGTVLPSDTVTSGAITNAAVTPAKWTNPYKFSAYLSSAQSIPNSTDTVVLFDAELFDTNGNFDITTNKGRYTAPVAGFYQFNVNAAGGSGSFAFIVGLRKNGSNFTRLSQIGGGGWVSGSITLQLSASDYVEVYVFQNTGGSVSINSSAVTPYNTQFSGFLVSQT